MRYRNIFLAALACLGLWTAPARAQTPIYSPMCPGGSCQFFDNQGAAAANAKLCTYAAGTTTGLATYADSAGMSSNAVPPTAIALSSAGRAIVFLGNATYKFTLLTAGTDGTCATGTILWTVDNVPAAAPWNLSSLTGKVQFTTPASLTVTANAVTPSQNVQGLDTSGGAGTLNTINTTNVASGFILYLYGTNSASDPVTVTSAGNISLANGNFTINNTSAWLQLILRGSTWYELARNGGTIGTFQCAYTKSAQTTSSSPAMCTLVEQTAGSGVTLTLPSTAGCTANIDRVGIKNDTANVITVAAASMQTIDGASTFSTYGIQYESFDFVCNAAGTGWMVR